MKYDYIFHPTAQEEYESSLDWYLGQSERAAIGFVKAIESTIIQICDNPQIWRNEYKHYYELTLKKYPFTIIYAIEKDERLIVIIAIFHHKRNPKKKYRRTK